MPKNNISVVIHNANPTIAPWFANDRWRVEDIGLKPDTSMAGYYINFERLAPTWFKDTVKRFVLFQAATKTYASCRSYAVNLSLFSAFLMQSYPNLEPHQINRTIVTNYMTYLLGRNLNPQTRNIALIHLRTLHAIVLQEKWLPWPHEPLVYNHDLSKPHTPLPRFIPEIVIAQLKAHLVTLPQYLQHFVIILLETGRRISEVCTLPFDCLERDNSDGVFLRIHDHKLKKHYLIPISPECISAITNQQEIVLESLKKIDKKQSLNNTVNSVFLFPSKRISRSVHITASHVNQTLNGLAEACKIVDHNKVVWHFHAHQFRHTLGTRMINAGVPQAIVQRYLGHETPEMTTRYAYIHHDTLKKSFQQFQATMIDIKGDPRPIPLKHHDAFLLKQHIMAQALPNGFCGLPSIQQRCPHANACLTCTHFRTHKDFLPQHETQLKETQRIIETAKTNGWQRQAEMNIAVKQNLEAIISQLKKEPADE